VKLLFLHRGGLFFTAGLFTLLTISLAVFPQEGLEAAREGLKIFWEIVLPSLLPFFVLSEILLGLGVVHFFGVLLEPLMRPVFNVPGAGAFALSMGLVAGYPMDAVITGKFRRRGLCTKIEGERLLAFTNTADPLFMFGAVAVGMFGYPQLGMTIAVAHYLAAFSVGFIFRFYGQEPQKAEPESRESGLFRRAVQKLYQARMEDNRPLGQLLGDAVKESIGTLFMIGGFIVLFSVLSRVMEEIGLFQALLPAVGGVLNLFGLEPVLAGALLKGIMEIDLGVMATAQATATLDHRLIVAGVIIAWSGLSVHGQVISVIHDTDIRILPYFIARVCHGLLAGFYTFLFLGTVKTVATLPSTRAFIPFLPVLKRWQLSTTGFFLLLGMLIFLALLFYLGRRYRLVRTLDSAAK